ncbi:De-etiolated protein 1, Det1 domain-containing protein [Rozella allomycis CSF55]|uniref:De-etiolated protein 1, Det1 domain-containing protein n=1 Tax=Rozella allomycis (strain CSF55) TaxID=988480 RepID=A0A075AUZ0_ROZAC|nr:De-etiolated protein 1, Det1 domain-containing protein [Rozella allomycis CSF55]|eukprot:EPZ33985.1 De-etiolated protein 1, Det1 domain-containing protein [Rozella allomycis CSF55]
MQSSLEQIPACQKRPRNLFRKKYVYISLPLNQTSYEVATVDRCVKKFSPDGKYIVAIDKACHSVFIHDVFHYPSEENVVNFTTLFPLKSGIQLTTDSQLICKEFMLFHEHYLILASAVGHSEFVRPPNQNPNSIQMTTLLDDVTFHCINMEDGVETGRLTFPFDLIFLSYQTCVHMFDNMICIVSSQHQLIYIMMIKPDGGLAKVKEIGYTVYEDDNLTFNDTDFNPDILYGIKQKMITFLFRKAYNEGLCSLMRFYNIFDQLRKLVIWRVQFIDKDNLIIKLTLPECIPSRSDSNIGLSLYLFYNHMTATVLQILDHSSHELMALLESHNDIIQNVTPPLSNWSNNKYERQKLKRQREIYSHSKLAKYFIFTIFIK